MVTVLDRLIDYFCTVVDSGDKFVSSIENMYYVVHAINIRVHKAMPHDKNAFRYY